MTERPLVTNSLFNVTFEAEDSSPALVPVSLDDDTSHEEIKSDILTHLPPTTVPVPVQSTNIYNSTENESLYTGDVPPIDVFRNYTSHGTSMDPFSSASLLNSHNHVLQPSAPFMSTQTGEFLAGPPLTTFRQQEISSDPQKTSLSESTKISVNATFFNNVPPPTNVNQTSYFENGSFVNNHPPPTGSSSYMPPSNYATSEITRGMSGISIPPARPPILNETYSLPQTENKFRLASNKPVYAKYPGLISDTMGGSHGLPPPPGPPGATDSTHNNTRPSVFSPVSSFYSTTENGPGYSFGEPIPVPSSQTYQQLHPAVYKPVAFHWFYRIEIEGRTIWKSFSYMDSKALEEGYQSNPEKLVPTDGGRCDVDVQKRVRKTVYWEEDVHYEVRRASWFYKGPMDSRFIPYDEEFAQHLEKEYEHATVTGEWHKRLEFDGGEAIEFRSNSIVHFCQAASPDEWGNLPESQLRPRVVKRGVEELEIDYGEPTQVDHLVFLVHGIGAICDFKFRSITEAVDDFRDLTVHMMNNHFREAVHTGRAGRVEFLPVSWHKSLHSDGGIDKKLKPITLPSIPKLRHFTNDTLLDILFYTSPVYCQTIVDTVANEMNRMYNLFLERNEIMNGKPFNGKVSLGGHSLGSVILFDLLAHQKKPAAGDENIKTSSNSSNDLKNIDSTETLAGPKDSLETSSETTLEGEGSAVTRTPSYTVVSGGTGQPFINYPTLDFSPSAFFAMGSPTAMFVTVRGLDELGTNFHFPTCPAFFNIFHPYDPVAYRMESLIDQNVDLPPVMIPHHKGRKRFHLELKDTVTRVSADLKNKFLESIRTTWNTVSQLTHFGRGENAVLEVGNSAVSTEDWNQSQIVEKQDIIIAQQAQEMPEQEVRIGQLNRGRRIDYVLQESPVEILNEYLFALTSHVCYWFSEDVSLFLLKELYSTLDIFEDGEVTAQTPMYGTIVPDSTNYSTTDFGVPPPNPPLLLPQDATSPNADVPLVPPMPSVPNYYSSAQGSYGSINRINRPYVPFPDGPIQPNISGLTGQGVNSFAYGMDPTAPMVTPSNIKPPPLSGFVSKG